MNTTTAPKFKVGVVLKVYEMMTKITVYLVDAMDSEMKKVEELLQLQTIQKLEILGV